MDDLYAFWLTTRVGEGFWSLSYPFLSYSLSSLSSLLLLRVVVVIAAAVVVVCVHACIVYISPLFSEISQSNL